MARQTPDWQRALAAAIDRPADLYTALDLDPDDLPAAHRAAAHFPLRVPRGYVARMRRGDRDDPLLRQVLPLGAELRPMDGFVTDPVGDLHANPAPGLLHKYHGRALLIATGACAIHCRYCFRRHFPYQEHLRGALDAAIDAIAADPAIEEIILSGGDPLSLSDSRLERLTGRLRAIPHVRRLRFHTRLPIVLPERVTADLLALLRDGSRTTSGATTVRTVMVVHANHPNEIDAPVAEALHALRASGCTLLNQAVLLRGVNDDADVLAALSERLLDAAVLPYYLHQLDRVAGAAHFEVSDTEALALHQRLRERLPGYLVPRLVREIPGEAHKTPLA